jgi:hypothetical protein
MKSSSTAPLGNWATPTEVRVRRAGAKDGNQEIGSGVRDLAVLSERWRGANEDAHARDADNSLERAADLLDQHERAQRTQLRSEASLLECDLGPALPTTAMESPTRGIWPLT